MSLINLVAPAPKEAPAAPATPSAADVEQTLLVALAEQLECEPAPAAIAARITALAEFEDKVLEALGADDANDACEVIAQLQDADDNLPIIADVLQSVLGLSDSDLRIIASSATPEWTARQMIAGGTSSGGAVAVSPLRTMVQLAIEGLSGERRSA